MFHFQTTTPANERTAFLTWEEAIDFCREKEGVLAAWGPRNASQAVKDAAKYIDENDTITLWTNDNSPKVFVVQRASTVNPLGFSRFPNPNGLEKLPFYCQFEGDAQITTAVPPIFVYKRERLSWSRALEQCRSLNGDLGELSLEMKDQVAKEAAEFIDESDTVNVWTNAKPEDVYIVKHASTDKSFVSFREKYEGEILPFYCQFQGEPPTTSPSYPSTTSDVTTTTSAITNTPTSIPPTTLEPKCCPRINDLRGLTWQRTCGDVQITQNCPPPAQNGTAVWYCDGKTGQWYPSSPDLSSCKSPAVDDILKKIDLSDILGTYNYLSQAAFYSYAGGDIIAIEEIVNNVTSSLENKNNLTAEEWLDVVENVTDAVADTMNSFLGSTEIWTDIPESERVKVADRLLTNVNKVGFTLVHVMNDSQHTVEKEHVFLQAIKEPRGSFEHRNLTLPMNASASSSLDVIMTLNSGFEDDLPAVTDEDVSGYTIALFTTLQNMEEVLLLGDRSLLRNSTNKTKVNSPVISLSLLEDSNISISLSNEMRFVVPLKKGVNADLPICAFWNVMRRTWDDGGCWVVTLNDTHITCACDHLTNFALLMDVHGVVSKFSESDLEALTIITYVGCTISILSLAICVCLTTAIRQLWCIRNTIHRNLALCLLIAEVFLITGLERTENKIVCSVVAGFLHYFFLAAFCWMLLEAVFIYILLEKVFAQRRSYAERYYFFGYGFPLLIIAISAGANPDGYGTDKHCWLSSENGMMWSFGAPVLVIVVVNFMALVFALHTAIVMAKKKADDQVTKQWIYGSMTLVPILGLTWGVGFLTWNNSGFGVVSAYAFTILNSLQGLAIFLVQVVMNKKLTELNRSGTFSSVV